MNMYRSREVLSFDVLDDLVLARERGRAPSVRLLPGECLGAIVELLLFCQDHREAFEYSTSPETAAMTLALERRRPVYRVGESIGFIAARRAERRTGDNYWDAFMFAMYKAMRRVGFRSLFSRGLVGAVEEMETNIHEHCGAIDTGVVGYRVGRDRVEWTVADRGIGVLRSLRSGAFPSLRDSGEALRVALAEGRSRHGAGHGRGYGFRQLFKALSTRRGALRFRSDDQVLTMKGVSPSLSRAQLQQRANVAGFSISVVCTKPRELPGK